MIAPIPCPRCNAPTHWLPGVRGDSTELELQCPLSGCRHTWLASVRESQVLAEWARCRRIFTRSAGQRATECSAAECSREARP